MPASESTVKKLPLVFMLSLLSCLAQRTMKKCVFGTLKMGIGLGLIFCLGGCLREKEDPNCYLLVSSEVEGFFSDIYYWW